MEKFIEKLSSYNLLNNLLPGVVFFYSLKIMFNINLPEGIFEKFFIYYFIGIL